MKKIYFIFALCLLIVSCKNNPKANETETKAKSETTSESGITTTRTVGDVNDTFSGMFLYLDDEKAAVLQTAGSKMYGVVIDDKMHELNKECQKFKKNNHDMVPVVVRGIKKPNPVKDAWKEVIEVKEILSVQQPSGQDGTIIITNNQ
ncbi:hypothetical protein [Kordia sp.]|uniref:hypothetical protein n=1 Tax=Kordia sp. TaxID=1965332 RepID=UPI0025C2BF5F|nr:hypothetical protein [Kordia sp.]MCH2193418.1 hypothetical protein [Kordia sp.]